MPWQMTGGGTAEPALPTDPGPDVRVTHHRTLALLTLATAVGSMGLAAGGTAGGLLATELTRNAATAGLPLGVLVAGSAVGALMISKLASRAGRAAGLILGYAAGAGGAAIVIAATAADSFALVLIGNAAMGAANASVFLTRYAAADTGGPATRGRALSTVMFAASAGAVTGPNLLGPSGELAGAIGLRPIAGLYLIAAPSFAVAGLLLAALRRSAAAQPGRAVAARVRARDSAGQFVAAVGARPVRTALLILGAVNLVMVGIMAIAPIHLVAHDHELKLVGFVISIHVAAMFVPSPLSGWAADRAGGGAVASLGAAMLIAAGVTGVLDQPASCARPASCAALIVALVLLGLGWNAGVVGASIMLAASVPTALRTRAEGAGETAMGLAAAAGAPLAGLVTAAAGFAALSVLAATVATLVLAAVALPQPRRPHGHEPRPRPGGRASRCGDEQVLQAAWPDGSAGAGDEAVPWRDDLHRPPRRVLSRRHLRDARLARRTPDLAAREAATCSTPLRTIHKEESDD
jgi:MFS family permease